MSDIIELKAVEAALLKSHTTLEQFITKSNEEISKFGKVQEETKSAVTNVSAECIKLADRVAAMEQKITAGAEEGRAEISLGEQFVKSDGFIALAEGRQSRARLNIKTAIINQQPVNTSQPLVQGDRLAGIVSPANRMLHMRDILPVGRTSSNLIEFCKENVFTNNAGPTISGSPEQVENVTKPESAITFTLATEPVRTLAHFIPASTQVLADSPMLESYINGRLMYGLKLKEDTQILLGTGANGQLNGLYTNRTAYSVASPQLYTTKLDVLRDAIKQVQTSEYMPTGIVLHPTDWMKIELSKDSQLRYLFANPQSAASPSLWGLPVVVTNSITSGTFLVGAFDMAAQLWDRQDAVVEMSLEDSTNFQKNMVTIRCEERLALTIYRALALVGGAFIT
jgi:HK97 family phage major capsid protein